MTSVKRPQTIQYYIPDPNQFTKISLKTLTTLHVSKFTKMRSAKKGFLQIKKKFQFVFLSGCMYRNYLPDETDDKQKLFDMFSSTLKERENCRKLLIFYFFPLTLKLKSQRRYNIIIGYIWNVSMGSQFKKMNSFAIASGYSLLILWKISEDWKRKK